MRTSAFAAVFAAVVIIVVYASTYHVVGYDQGGHAICEFPFTHDRVYDCDAVFDPANPDGIDRTPRVISGVVEVPGPMVWKAIEDLTPEDRAWLATRTRTP